MSASASIIASLRATIGSLTANLVPSTLSITPSADPFVENLQAVGTSAEAITVGDIGTAGWALFLNTDATNFVVLSLINDGTTPFAKLLAGEFCLIPLGTKTIYAKADTAGINLAYVILSR